MVLLLFAVWVGLFGAAAGSTAIGSATAERGWIAYSNRDGHIWVVDGEGRHARRVTSSSSERDIAPSWSPDGRRLVFKAVPVHAKQPSRASAIVVANLDGSGRHVISPTQDVESPRWSPDGKLIAFQLRDRVALVRPNGSGLKVLSIHGGCPSWAPSSKVIAICGDDGAIYTIHADGSDRRLLTKHAGAIDAPGPWSPDGRRLSLLRQRGGQGDIYVVGNDGSHLTRVTSFPGIEAPNAWLRSGRIVFPLYRSGDRAQWFTIQADGQGLRRLFQLKIDFDPIDWHQ